MSESPTTAIGHVSAEFLRAAANLFQPVKRRSYELMHLRAGSSALDIGSGTGADVLELAGIVGAEGKATGLDFDAAMVRAAAASVSPGSSGSIAFVEADATALPFDDETFDAVRSERTFQHLQQPERALAEARRVTRAGGRVVVLDPDYAGMSVDTSFPDFERRFIGAMAAIQANGYSARSLPRQLAQAGLVDVTVELFPLRISSYPALAPLLLVKAPELLRATGLEESALEAFVSELEHRWREGVLFAYVTMIVTSGRVPLR